MAFSLKMSPDEARSKHLFSDDFIFKDGKVWIPVEITNRGTGFQKAWQVGAKEWREHSSNKQSGFYPIHDAWELYDPVGFPGTVTIVLPEKDEVLSCCKNEVMKFIEREMSPQISELEAEITETQGNIKVINKLGVLYARFGFIDKAEEQFQRVLNLNEYVPSLVNMGNLCLMSEEMEPAKDFYLRAEKVMPNHPTVLLSIARVNHAMENYDIAREIYGKLNDIDPSMASRFTYLGFQGEDAARASEAVELGGGIFWEEE